MNKTFSPTPEQVAIRDSQSPSLIVTAFAGASKTTTCELYAAARPNKRFLYVAFNKPVQIEASKRFPSHVECRTMHSLAYSKFGARYKHKMTMDSMRPSDILPIIGSRDASFAQLVIRALTLYFSSAHREIADALRQGAPTVIIDAAREVWRQMKDTENQVVKMIPDGYLKLFQLSNPVLDYDVILVDEAQDTNPVMADVVARQRCRKVFVGDPHQQIYLFRGARNIMRDIDGERLMLSHSFRFGETIAATASRILAFKGERTSIVGRGGAGRIGAAERGTIAHICRSNAGVFDAAARAVRSKKRLDFAGGIDGYRFKMIESAWNLKVGLYVQDPYIRTFASFEEMQKTGLDTDDKEINMLVKVVDEYGSSIPALLHQIRESTTSTNPDIILMTGHKSKGLEFDQVSIEDDFYSISRYVKARKSEQDRRKLDDLDVEMNLLYVAATRARRVLVPNSDMMREGVC